MTSPLSRYFSCNRTNPGISALHGPHHVAQKFRSTTLPLYADSDTSLPSTSFIVKSKLACLAFAMHAAEVGSSSCEAAATGSVDALGVLVAAGSPSICDCHTNGIAIASSATAVIATAIMRPFEVALAGSEPSGEPMREPW